MKYIKNEGSDGSKGSKFTTEKCWAVTTNLVFWSSYNGPTRSISISTKEVFRVQGAWYSVSTLPFMVHGKIFRIIT